RRYPGAREARDARPRRPLGGRSRLDRRVRRRARRDARDRPHRRVHARRLGRAAREADPVRGGRAARPGGLEQGGPRVPRPGRAQSLLGDDLELDHPRPGEVYFNVSEGLRLGLVEAPTEVEYDLDHVALWSEAPEETADAYERLGFSPAVPGASGEPRVEVGG